MYTMAANRDERFLMRQRGAGTRDINLTFDLQLPGVPTISRSPLRPQKSGRSQLENPNLKATRQTPKSKKAISKLVSKRTSATANNATPRTAVRGSHVERPDTSKQDQVPEAPQHVSHGVSAQKRKVDLYLTEGTTEGAELPPTKRRKKRKSIGQYPIRRKSTGAPPSKKPVQESKKRDKTKKVKEVPPETMELVPEKIHQASEIYSENKTMQDPMEALEVAQVTNGPNRRKRRSNGQVQRPKKTPKLAGQAMVHTRADDVEQQHIPAVADASLGEPPQTSEIPKPQRRKRKTLMETSTRHKTAMQMPSPQSVIRISDAVRNESVPDQSIGKNVAAGQPKKRGRKPNATVKDTTKNPKEAASLPMAVLEIPTAEGEPLILGEVQPKADEASTVLKKTRKKRKPIGQTQKVKKKPAIGTLRAIDPKPPLVSDEAAKNRRTAAAKSPPISQHRSHPESPRELSPELDQARVVPDQKSSVPAPAPNKRGRPKKAQAAPLTTKTASAEIKSEHEVSIPAVAAKKRGRPKQADAAPQEQPTAIEPFQGEPANEKLPSALTAQLRGRLKKAQTPQAAEVAEIERKHDEAEPVKAPPKRRGPKQRMPSAKETMPLEICQPVNQDAVLAPPRSRAAKNASKLAVQENGREALPEVLEVPDAPDAEPEHRVLSPAPVKKRGRPKKQAATPLVVEAAGRKNAASQLRTCRYQSSAALAKCAPANVSRSRAKQSTALPVQEDVDEDPLSECTLLLLKHEAKANPVTSRFHLVPKGTSLPSHKPETTVNDHSDLHEEAPVLKLTKRRVKALAKEPAGPCEPESEVAAPHPPARPSPQQGTPSLESQDSSPPPLQQHHDHHQHHRRTADLESHIEQSLLEENALKADLRELQAQRALEIVEQEERDRDVRLERLSAGVTTKKKQQQQHADDVPQHQVHEEEPVLLGAKKKKKNARGLENLFRTVSGARKGSGGGDIDPDLQGILDQVKGVARGSGGIMKIF